MVEMGLVKLTASPVKEYLATAKYFIEERGHYNGYDPKSKDPWKNGAYWQDHIPVVDQREAIGHAVRQAIFIPQLRMLLNQPAMKIAERCRFDLDNMVTKKLSRAELAPSVSGER